MKHAFLVVRRAFFHGLHSALVQVYGAPNGFAAAGEKVQSRETHAEETLEICVYSILLFILYYFTLFYLNFFQSKLICFLYCIIFTAQKTARGVWRCT